MKRTIGILLASISSGAQASAIDAAAALSFNANKLNQHRARNDALQPI